MLSLEVLRDGLADCAVEHRGRVLRVQTATQVYAECVVLLENGLQLWKTTVHGLVLVR